MLLFLWFSNNQNMFQNNSLNQIFSQINNQNVSWLAFHACANREKMNQCQLMGSGQRKKSHKTKSLYGGILTKILVILTRTLSQQSLWNYHMTEQIYVPKRPCYLDHKLSSPWWLVSWWWLWELLSVCASASVWNESKTSKQQWLRAVDFFVIITNIAMIAMITIIDFEEQGNF